MFFFFFFFCFVFGCLCIVCCLATALFVIDDCLSCFKAYPDIKLENMCNSRCLFLVKFDIVRVDAFVSLICERDCFGWIDTQ